MRLRLPSLVSLSATFQNPHLYLDDLRSFPETSPNIRTLSLDTEQSDVVFDKFVSSCICRWQTLQYLSCGGITLDADALMHLSRMPTLTQLKFAQSAAFSAPHSSLVFANLNDITFESESWEPILQFLYQAQLPAITTLNASVDNCPLRLDLASFLASVPKSNTGHTIKTLMLEQLGSHFAYNFPSDARPLGLQDLQPCMVFSNLRHIELNAECNVDLTDIQLLTLASSWPKLEYLKINEKWC